MTLIETVTEYQLASFIEEKTEEGFRLCSITAAAWHAADRGSPTHVTEWKVVMDG